MTTDATYAQTPLARLLPDPGSANRQPLSETLVRTILHDHYRFADDLRVLTAERDQNFRVRDETGAPFVFKIFGLSPSAEEADLLGAVLPYLERQAPGLPVPRLTRNALGEAITHFTDGAGRARTAIAYSFLPGVPAFDAARSPAQHRNCGTLLAKLALALEAFSHPAMHRPLIWDLRNLPALRGLLPQLGTLHFADFAASFLDRFAERIAPQMVGLPQQFVHNDMNAGNIIVDPQDPSRITGVIDFGDALHTCRIADVAVGVIGQLSSPETASVAIDEFVAAYRAINPLTPQEVTLLPWLIAGRIVQNLVMTTWYRERHPDGEHFAAFGRSFFEWRIDLAGKLTG